MSPARQIVQWADKIRDMAANGLRYAPTHYDHDRYAALQQMAMEMLAFATAEPLEQFEPLRATVFSHITPFAVADGAVIDDAGRLLMIRRADNGLWAMPGGALEVGETPAAGACREVFEETGVRAEPVALAGVFDSRLLPAPMRHHLYMFVFLCRPLDVPPVSPSHANEVLEVAWFPTDALPPDLDPRHGDRIVQVLRVWRGESPPFFDR
jgi:ADP-ribose pyrophosphatase YjhB (NUDIX family)